MQKKIAVLSFDSSGKYLATGTSNKKAYVFDVDSLQKITSFSHKHTIKSVTFSPCSTYLATGSGWYFSSDKTHGKVRLFDWKNNKELCTFDYKSPVTSVAFHPSGNFLAIGIHDGTVRIVYIHTQRQIKLSAYKYDAQNPELCISVSFDLTGEKLAVGLLRIQKALVYNKISQCSLQQLMLFKIISLWFQVKNQNATLKEIDILIKKKIKIQNNSETKKNIETYTFNCITNAIDQQFNIRSKELKKIWSALPSDIQFFVTKHINNLMSFHTSKSLKYQ